MDRVIEPSNEDHIKRSSQEPVMLSGLSSYINGIHVAGFCATGLLDLSRIKLILLFMHKNKNHHEDDPTLKKALKTLHGPDDLLGTTASADPVSVVTCASTQTPAIDERNIHHADLDNHTLH